MIVFKRSVAAAFLELFPVKMSMRFLRDHFHNWWGWYIGSLGVLYLFYEVEVPRDLDSDCAKSDDTV